MATTVFPLVFLTKLLARCRNFVLHPPVDGLSGHNEARLISVNKCRPIAEWMSHRGGADELAAW